MEEFTVDKTTYSILADIEGDDHLAIGVSFSPLNQATEWMTLDEAEDLEIALNAAINAVYRSNEPRYKEKDGQQSNS